MSTLNNITHVAIIPDGNRRWAKKRGLLPWKGHLEGAENFERISDAILDLNIKYITFWGGSFDNLTKRQKEEIKILLLIYRDFFGKLLKAEKIHKNRIKVQVLGRFREFLPKKTIDLIDKLDETTKGYNNHFLTLLIGYNGTDEMLEAVQKIADLSKKGSLAKVTSETIKKNLWTKELPPVDLIIRTGEEGNPHNSAGFMMWDAAYSQYYFTKTLWPDFSPAEFREAIGNFLKINRRFGA